MINSVISLYLLFGYADIVGGLAFILGFSTTLPDDLTRLLKIPLSFLAISILSGLGNMYIVNYGIISWAPEFFTPMVSRQLR